ncbi:Rv1733c family protein [Actinomycetospora flava]|uniref:Transmembrane protein n=1 Tax=Actinomycetospora flava TaxID=3129232 RepID=A0ABU8MDG2_9PSEU
MGARTGAVRRAVGVLVPPRSALRRPSDRLEVTARWVLLLTGLLLLPLALAAGGEVTARLGAQAAIEHGERHPVTAVVLPTPTQGTPAGGDVASAPADGWTDRSTDIVRTPVRWTGADGTPRTGLARVPDTTVPGETRVLWVDAADRPTPPPMPPTAPGAHGALVTGFLLLIHLTVSLVLLAGLRHVLDRARLRSWDRAWRRFTDPEPDPEPDPDRLP